ncbi:hemolysin family protein [Dellaglioa algida]|uniref:hemolysin family protein n=1 Tax=Dellaglioa algida TaxID=105612 RepID=UPI000BD05E34|nr:hemolysin family protein [Dellaglioa algida]MDK1718978.1 hemolysin family protein [Dellaglioa algida]MDK1730094.1 hemolysin family protein [Dellaglioa algida]MDK1742528.1 hemolysin family protein [Dellaglioa algida]SOB51578.1 putative ion Mg(2+)/Co(2+) transport protein, hemolysinC-family [Dellaglioa algida]
MSSSTVIVNLIVILVTLFAAAFFVAAEFALVQARPSAIEADMEAGIGNRKKQERALKMLAHLNEYLSTTQVGVSVAGIILGWVGEKTIEFLLVDVLKWFHFASESGLNIIGAIIGVLILTYVEVVYTEIVPKNLSIDMPVQVLMVVLTPLRYFHLAFYPLVWLLNNSATRVARMLGITPTDENSEIFTQKEILALSQNAVSGGELDRDDYVYMQRAFDLNDKIAKDIMVDRTSLYVVDITDTIHDVIKDYLHQGYSRFPVVANNDKDKILGYVYIYDLVRQAEIDDTILVSKMLRSIITVPETTPIRTLLSQMISKQTPIVVVSDEYGGTSGIVTDKDIYEELFGTVKDEIDDVSSEYIVKNDDGTYNVSGKTTLYDFERFFKIKNKEMNDSESVTLAGFILENHKVRLNEVIRFDAFDFKIIEFKRNYIDWFQVSYSSKQPETTGEEKISE